jgi:hypothetical protein
MTGRGIPRPSPVVPTRIATPTDYQTRRRIQGVRLFDSELEQLRRVAARSGLGWSTWVRRIALSVADALEEDSWRD